MYHTTFFKLIDKPLKMKQFFQWINDHTGVDTNTSATLFITIVVFGMGLLATYIAGKIKERIENRNYRENVDFLLEEICSSCMAQHKNFLKVSENVSFYEGKNHSIDSSVFAAANYFQKIDTTKLLAIYSSIWNNKIKRKAIAKLVSTVEVIITKGKRFDKTVSEVNQKFLATHKEYNNLLSELKSINARYMKESNCQLGDIIRGGNYRNDFIIIYLDWQKNGQNRVPKISFEQVIQPLYELNLKYHKEEDYLEVYKILLQCQACIAEFMGLDKRITGFAKNDAVSFRDFNRKLIVIRRILAGKKTIKSRNR